MGQWMVFLLKTIIAAAVAVFGGKHLYQLDHTAIISAAGVLSTVAGVLFGFILASLTLLTSFDSSKGLIGALKKNNVLQGIIKGLFSTGNTLIAGCLSALISMFAPQVLQFNVDYFFLLLSFSYLIISVITFCYNWKNFSSIITYV
ncbi:hypothetical protein [Citrobacter sp. Cpo126]|uniref:hypothetical protein n=1 Tax=Citrobacter sp. Cpo126 TaxID=2985148 RepID=UPI002577FB37|nr:hypothetical protein [Citrobacter sp. Cpo126]MDM2775004.1 hypothetical protein [Citrobacter sp. Cpo126]